MAKLVIVVVLALVSSACLVRPGANGNIEACTDGQGNGQPILICQTTSYPNALLGW